MSRPSSDYTVCPECQRRTVLFHFGKNGEDYLLCTRCRWEEFRWPTDKWGHAVIARWQALNPTTEQ